MGLEILGKQEAWGRLVYDLAMSTKEMARRNEACERVRLYRDDYKQLLAWQLSQIFTERQVYARLERLLPIIGGSSFVKRIANELGRPLYARAPTRRVVRPDGTISKQGQEAYTAIALEMGLNEKMDTMARLLTPSTSVLGFCRYIDDLGIQLDVMTPAELTVIEHPEVHTKALAIAYVKNWQNSRPYEWVVWDEKRYFTIGPRGGMRDLHDHNFGMKPFMEVHLPGRTDCYWQESLNQDLISQTKQSMFFDCMMIKKIKAQSHIQVKYIGDSEAFVKSQVLDEESVLHAESGTIDTLNFESNPKPILELKLANEAAVAANYGISRDRLNQQKTTGDASDDVALHERVAELAGVMVPGEVGLFEIVKRVSQEHPKYKGWIAEDDKLLVDLGQIHNRVDRKTQLDIRQTERSMGLRSGVDDVLEDKPEFGGDADLAMAYIRQKMAEEAIIVEARRALNIPADGGSPGSPSQSPEQNGAMGPMVRDGSMTRDEAAMTADEGMSVQTRKYVAPSP